MSGAGDCPTAVNMVLMSLPGSSRDVYAEFAPFYDLFYANRQPEIAFYTSLLRAEDNAVLELGCGTGVIVGAVAGELSRRHGHLTRAIGLDCFCKDASPRSRSVRVSRLGAGRHDSTTLAGAVRSRICAFNTLQMLPSSDHVLRVFTAARRLLGRQGRLAIDLYNPHLESATAPVTRAAPTHRRVGSFADTANRFLEVHEWATEDSTRQWVELDWRVIDGEMVPPEQRARLVVRLHHYDHDVISRLLNAAALRIIERYGDVHKSPFEEQQSIKQVLVCSR